MGVEVKGGWFRQVESRGSIQQKLSDCLLCPSLPSSSNHFFPSFPWPLAQHSSIWPRVMPRKCCSYGPLSTYTKYRWENEGLSPEGEIWAVPTHASNSVGPKPNAFGPDHSPSEFFPDFCCLVEVLFSSPPNQINGPASFLVSLVYYRSSFTQLAGLFF